MISEDQLRRVKLVHVSELQILGILTGHLTIELKGVPKGSQVLRVYHDDPRKCFVLMVHHESFDEVPTGQMPDDAEGELTWRYTSEIPSGPEDWRGHSPADAPPYDGFELDQIERAAVNAYENGASPGYHAVTHLGVIRLVREIKDRRAREETP